jgi:hypothetical protein
MDFPELRGVSLLVLVPGVGERRNHGEEEERRAK